jgi:hypothetical protein
LTARAARRDRGLADRLQGLARAGPSKWFRKVVDTPGLLAITANGVIVRVSNRAHKPVLTAAGLTPPTRAGPGLGGRCVRLVCR